MNFSVILQKKPGHTIPAALITHVNKLRGSVSGFAVRHADGGKTEIDYEYGTSPQADVQFQKVLDASSDNTLFLFFSDKKGKFDIKNDVQPFVLTNGEDAMLAVFLEGDFPKYANPAGTRSDEGNFWEQFLEPMLVELAGDAKDIDDFYAKLRRKTFQDTLINASNNRCVFGFLPLTGEPILFGNNELGKEYEWGNISDNMGFGDVKEKHIVAQAASVVAEVAKSTKRRFFSDASASPAPEVIQPEVPKTPDTKHTLPAQPPGGDVKTETAISAGAVWLAPPEGAEKSVRNMWYRTFNKNQLPKDHDRRPKILVEPAMIEFAKRKVITSGELKTLVADIKNGSKIIAPKDFKNAHTELEKKTADIEVNVTGKQPASTQLKVVPQNVDDYIPDMKPDEVTKAMGLAVSFMGDVNKRPTLLDLQRIEEGWPKFSAKVGIPLADTMYWTPDQLMQLEKKMLVQLLNEFKTSFRQTSEFKDMVDRETIARVNATKEIHKTSKEELVPEPTKVAASGGGKRRFFG